MEVSQYLFTDVYRHTSPSSCQFSPGTTFFAVAVEDHVIVRVTETMQLVRTWACRIPTETETNAARSEIRQVLWSPDSNYIMACAPRSGCTWIFGLADPSESPRAIVQAGSEGLVRSEWSPDSTAVLCFSEQRLRLSIYSIAGAPTSYIESFKSPSGCHSYRQDRRYFAVAEKHKGKESLAIYDAGDQYNLIRSFPIATHDVQGVSWSPCGRWIAVWDHRLEYSLHVYSPLGPRLTTFSSTAPSFIGPDPGLGVRLLAWGPGGNWLGVGGYDGKVRIIEADGWRCMSTLDPARHKRRHDTTIWTEPLDWYIDAAEQGPITLSRNTGEITWNTVSSQAGRVKEAIGVVHLEWNADGTSLFVHSENTPNDVHIFDFLPYPSASGPAEIRIQTILHLSEPVRQAKWNPARLQCIAVVTLAAEENLRGTGSGVFLWDGDWEEERSVNPDSRTSGSAAVIAIPLGSFETHDIRWSPDGDHLCIIDKSRVCIVRESTIDDSTPNARAVTDLSTIAE
ncbi:hypothetical protein FFLO_02814 [Filobasidium floriforme]|uniref:Uncharacterized protein n=1 Tax=Filobasidium floriforme TaxID=5210 RepID=A0A8K0JNA5_9TREE|nr:uncharacterized protein HD553DRAFT_316824 [Filobasidium floriforme]KAG7558251.1 hypothetical protein FFLO_02814 [Filobasidium floriforme]KAH8080474.1 hypothetical protein HD553DRAFT_316824 [Filobasidium floriforme]